MMTPTDPTTDDAVLAELKREARRLGHVAFTLTREEVSMYLMWLLGIALGLTLAGGRQ